MSDCVESLNLPSTLEEASIEFRRLLRKTGYPEQIVWITCSNLILRPDRAFIRIGNEVRQHEHACSAYADALRNRFAIAIEGWAASDHKSFAEVWALQDESEAQHLMMSSNLIKYSVAHPKRTADEVKNSLRWAYLKWSYARDSYVTISHNAYGVIH